LEHAKQENEGILSTAFKYKSLTTDPKKWTFLKSYYKWKAAGCQWRDKIHHYKEKGKIKKVKTSKSECLWSHIVRKLDKFSIYFVLLNRPLYGRWLNPEVASLIN